MSDRGEEIVVEKSTDEVSSFFARHIRHARFYCSLNWKWHGLKSNWVSLATNKYGGSVAGILLPDRDRKGLLIILPQLKHQSTFISELLTSFLPDVVPDLFPDVQGARWVERPDYEIPEVLELKRQIDQIQAEAETKVSHLQKQIEAEREKSGYLYDLIRGTDRKLVDAVNAVLTLLGFNKIVDVDHELQKKGQSGRDEDLQIHDSSPLLLVEIKGVSGLPSDDDALQVAKHIAPRMKQLARHDVQGLSIINHQRQIPGLDRDNVKPFRDVVVAAAKKHDVGLLTAWDLFRLARGFLRNKWTHK